MGVFFFLFPIWLLKEYLFHLFLVFIRDLSFGILFIRKLHQVHFVFLLFLSAFNLYCWKGVHFSWSLGLNFSLFFFGLIISFHFWFRDLLREFCKKYEILLMVLCLVFFLFLASEALLFISFFWASFHSLSSPPFPTEGFYVPDACQLTFANPLLLSNAAVSLGS